MQGLSSSEKTAANKITVRLQVRLPDPLRDPEWMVAERKDLEPLPLSPLPTSGLGLWAALIPFLLSVLEKIKIYNPLPTPPASREQTALGGEMQPERGWGSCPGRQNTWGLLWCGQREDKGGKLTVLLRV